MLILFFIKVVSSYNTILGRFELHAFKLSIKVAVAEEKEKS